MVQCCGHFGGRVITPDEAVEIPVNIPLRISIEPAPPRESEVVDWMRLLELAKGCTIEGPAIWRSGTTIMLTGSSVE